MKEFNKTITTIAAAAMAIGTLVPVAFAASTSSSIGGRKAVSVNGSVVSNPYTRVAKDAGTATSYIGVWYLGQAVKAAGGDYAWNPATKTFSITVPGVDGVALAAKIPNGVGNGDTTLVVNGVTVKKVNSFAAQDPAGSKSDITTFMPLFYLGEIFGELGGSSWDGNTFGFSKFQDTASKLTVTGSASGNVSLGNNDNFAVTGTDASGNPVQIPNGQVTWSANGGTINQSGNFTATTPGTYTITATYNGISATATVDYGLFVKSVSALNGGQLLVKFSQPVDQTTAELASHYALTDATIGSVGISGAALQADGQSVVLTLTNPIANNKSDDINVTVNGVGAKNNPATTVPVYSANVHVADTTAPAVASVVAAPTSSNSVSQVTVNFSEPVQAGAIVKVDGASAGVTDSGSSVTLNGLTLDPAKSHTLQIVNLTDVSGNVGQINQSFTVSTDKSAPAVSSVVSNGDHAILVTFSKVVQTATVNGAGAITVEDETGAPVSVATGAVTKYSGDTTGDANSGTQFIVPITDTSLYTSNKTSRTLTVIIAGSTVKDLAGNTLAAATNTVTLNEDTTAPTVTGLSYVTNSTTGNVTDIVATFSEPVASPSVLTGDTITDGNGVLEQSGFLINPTVSATDATKVDFKLATPAALSGIYSFDFAAGTAKDEAFAKNSSAAYAGTIDFGAPKASATTFDITSATTSSPDVITINFGTAVKGGSVTGSATNPADYTLNGSALPTGTTITLNAADVPAPGTAAQTIATITLPANSVAKNDTNAVFTIANVQDTNGDTVNPYTGTVGIVDNTSPIMSGASFNPDGTLSLAFNENVLAPSEADYSISINGGSALATDGSAYTVAQGTGSDYGKVVVTFKPATVINSGDTVTVKTQPNATTDNADGVIIASGTTVSAVK